jgi:Uma2 family endonuclease
VRDPPPEELGAPIDWSSWYLTDEEDMGEGNEQGLIIDVLRSSLRQLARERGWERVFIGADQFFAWVRDEPLVRISPDVYLLDDPPEPPLPASWQTWQPGHRAPRFAVEVVSSDETHPKRWRKDYDHGPQKYAQLGTSELVIFDPEVALGRVTHPERVPLQLYRREQDGAFVRVAAGAGPVYSNELEAWLIIRVDQVARLRLAHDEQGLDLVATAEEAAEQERQRAEQERQRAEQERQRAERLEAELALLRAKLDEG